MIRYVILSILVVDIVCWIGSIFISPKLNILCPLLSMTVFYILEYVSFEYDDYLGMSVLSFMMCYHVLAFTAEMRMYTAYRFISITIFLIASKEKLLYYSQGEMLVRHVRYPITFVIILIGSYWKAKHSRIAFWKDKYYQAEQKTTDLVLNNVNDGIIILKQNKKVYANHVFDQMFEQIKTVKNLNETEDSELFKRRVFE